MREHIIRAKDGYTTLVCSGVLVDHVDRVGNQAPGWAAALSPTDSSWQSLMKSTVKQWRSMVGDKQEDSILAFWRTVLVDLKQNTESTLASQRQARAQGATRLHGEDNSWLLSLEADEKLSELIEAWSEACDPHFRQARMIEQFNRRFFITGDGRYGLGPPTLMARDAICVLVGGRVAYALRERNDGKWCYVGEW